MIIRTIIVDDEEQAREGIRLRLKQYPTIKIIGEYSSGDEALEAINSLQPDLVFLDIQMPEISGLDVVRSITITPPPLIIFVTAYDSFAVQAFEYHALDYLLKPINDQRFQSTLARVTEEFKHRQLDVYTKKLHHFISEYEEQHRSVVLHPTEELHTPLSRILVKSNNQTLILSVDAIDWIESAGDYVYIHSSKQKHLLRETLSSLEQMLDPNVFIRIHRSSIVNINKIRSFKPNSSGDYDVFLYDGTHLKLSRNYRTNFQHRFKR